MVHEMGITANDKVDSKSGILKDDTIGSRKRKGILFVLFFMVNKSLIWIMILGEDDTEDPGGKSSKLSLDKEDKKSKKEEPDILVSIALYYIFFISQSILYIL